jgi:hypothetical protein
MERASVRPDDIVRLNKKGRAFGAFVLAKGNGALEIEPINRGITYMTASAREVICHWAKRGRPRARSAAGGSTAPSEREPELNLEKREENELHESRPVRPHPRGHEVVPAVQRLRLLAEGGVGALHALRRHRARLGGPRAARREPER